MPFGKAYDEAFDALEAPMLQGFLVIQNFGATIEPFGDSQRGSAGSCREPQFGASSAVAEPDERGQRLTWF